MHFLLSFVSSLDQFKPLFMPINEGNSGSVHYATTTRVTCYATNFQCAVLLMLQVAVKRCERLRFILPLLATFCCNFQQKSCFEASLLHVCCK